MTHRFTRLFGSAALVAIMSLPTDAQEYSNGGTGAAGRRAAILTPVEAYGVHPPGLAPADARHWKPYIPYYAPLSPVASSSRWRPWAYYPLLPYYTPYYVGYGTHRLSNPRPRPYGSNGWGQGPMPEMPLPEEPDTTPLHYANYTSVVADDTTYWNMGGNGLVPYGAAPPAEVRPADLVDAIQASRPRGRGHANVRGAAPGAPPAIFAPGEGSGDLEQGDNLGPEPSSHRRTKPAEAIPPGEASKEYGVGASPDRSSPSNLPAAPSPPGDSD
ncbi:MAG TPA: hypothetical protein PK867_14855 [Pirellulales bacterium]|nr:hypothetical protein [Pirellulales bacterium]